ncbi:MAG: tetratricopeptide repeat protein [Acidobacteriota bacterium]
MYRREKNTATMQKSSSQASKLLPENGQAYLQRGYVHLKNGNLDDAEQDFIAAERLSVGADMALSYECLGLMYGKQEKHPQAYQVLMRAIQLGRSSDATLFQLGWSCYQLKQWQKSIQYWSELHKHHPYNAQLAAYLLKAKYQLGIQNFQEGNLDTAISLLTEYLDSDPNNRIVADILIEAHFRQAASYQQSSTKISDKIHYHLEMAYNLAPENARVIYYRALIAAQSGDIETAIRLLHQVVVDEAYDQRSVYTLALLLYQNGDWTSSQAILKKLILAQQRSEWIDKALLVLAVLQAGEQCWSEAANTLVMRSSQLKTAHIDEYKLLWAALLQAGRLAELLELSSASSELSYYQVCGLVQIGRYDEAIAKLEPMLDARCNIKALANLQAELLCKVACQHARQDRWEESARELSKIFLFNSELRTWLEQQRELQKALAGFFLLAGKRSMAVKLWEQLQHSYIADTATAHALFIVSFWDAIHYQTVGNKDEALDAWQRVIRNVVLQRLDDVFWQQWQEQCKKRYGVAIDGQTISEIQCRLEEQLLNWLPLTHPLGVTLRSELAAARALKQIGGFPDPDRPGQVLVYGFKMLQYLNQTSEFGRFIYALLEHSEQRVGVRKVQELLLEDINRVETLPDVMGLDEVRRVARYFSRLGEAQVLFDYGRPQQALTVLSKACCEQCISSLNLSDWLPRVCQQDCDNFAYGNPAYVELKERWLQLWQDAAQLASEACLALADTEMIATVIDLRQITRHWKEALRLSHVTGISNRIQRVLTDHVLWRAATFEKQKQLDNAVQLLEGAHSLSQEPFRGELRAQLAKMLNYRGVAASELPRPYWQAIVGDFRRSVELNPNVPVRLVNLVMALRWWTETLIGRDSQAAARLLIEAQQVLGRGLNEFPQQGDLSEQVTDLKSEMEQVGFLLNRDGVEKVNKGDLNGGWEDLWLAYSLAPQSPHFRDNLRQATQMYVGDLIERKQLILAQEKLAPVLQKFPQDLSLRRLEARIRTLHNLAEK